MHINLAIPTYATIAQTKLKLLMLLCIEPSQRELWDLILLLKLIIWDNTHQTANFCSSYKVHLGQEWT